MVLTDETHGFQLVKQCSRIYRHKHVEKWWFSSSRTSSNTKNHENDAVPARTYLKYVRAQWTSLLTCDKAETMVFTMVLALPQEQDCDVVGELQVLTDM